MLIKLFSSILITLVISLPISLVMAEESVSAESLGDLELVKKEWRARYYMDPSADWSGYTAIQLEKAPVEFRKHWARDQRNRNNNRPTEKSMDRIKTKLSELLDEVFRQELTKNDAFMLSESSAEGVLRITPRIVDLDVIAPDRMRNHIGYSLTDSKGYMTLELDIHDSVSGKLLARMTDTREDQRDGWWEWTTSVSNTRAARFMLIRWSSDLREWLIEARNSGD